ncbi:MAG TPA: sulfurtransferase TusA family protein [Acidimicrobiia bacterium]|jgi:tRNA 2-thiouridine synthesizing protein A|nr:sulfurtransferase TusA family protein [Acidimicrobiia bacterium]
MTTQINVTESLDTSGVLCPLPVYKAALVLKRLQPGQVLELTCTDPGSLADIPAMARQRGDTLLKTDDRGETQVFWIEKGTSS